MKKIYLTIFAFIASFTILFAIELGQWDNFQDKTTQGWQTGASNPNPPAVVTDGGPEGDGDAYLLLTSNGSAGPGGRLIVFNGAQWTGDYTGAGIETISMHMNNFGTSDLSMRIAFQGPGGNFWSVDPVMVPASSGWVTVQFPVQAGDLTGGSNVSATLAGVGDVRILHSVSGNYIADIVNTQLGIDNITAADQPLPVEFIVFNAMVRSSSVNLSWTTASETNNRGFEVQRKVKDEEGWIKRGFVRGQGTSTEKHSYRFIDNNITGGNYSYRLKQIDYSGIYSYSDIVEVNVVEVNRFSLSQNYPNPFNPVTNFEFQIADFGFVSLKVYDVLGKEVATLVNEERSPGVYEIEFDASGFASGVYYYRLEAGNFSNTNKMMLIK